HLEATSGNDLTEFFNDWIYGEGYPSYQVDAEILSPFQTKIVLSQTTSHPSVPFFEMPVTLELKGSNNQTEIVVLEHSENHQEFIVDTHIESLEEIIVNPFFDIISKNHTVAIREGAALQAEGIVVFPNPTKTSFQVVFPKDMEVLSMNLYDVRGKLIARNISNPYNAERLSSGMYVLRIETSEKIYHKKVIKK
ncbi:MAG TPA: T9SS type A sorting domain-containing protein, partial [Flavobacterium sp.]|nr:T9SS type A sorting domain-containing protein [Flavobacterium sp.]